MKRCTHSVDRQRGVALLELTYVSAFLLVPLLAFVIEFGFVVHAYNVTVHQVGAAARYLSAMNPVTQFEPQARCLLLSGVAVADCSSTAQLLPGFASATVSIEQHTGVAVGGTANQKMNLVSVTVSGYRHHFKLTGFLEIFGLSSIDFKPITAVGRLGD